MATQCNDIETLLPTYLDGELAAADRLSFDHHTADCSECREVVRSEAAYRARVRELLAPPAAPDGLDRRVRSALDGEDMRARAARRQVGRSWALPGAAGLAAAAALALFVTSEVRFGPSANVGARLEHDARLVSGGGASSLGRRVSLPFFPPQQGGSTGVADATGDSSPPAIWRPTQATFDVRLRDGRHHQVRVEVLNCWNIDVAGHEKKQVEGVEMWVLPGEVNRVIHDADGTNCLLFASDMDVALLARLVHDVARGL